MTTLTLTSGQISQIIEIGKGTRVTSSGNGAIEFYPGSLADAKNGGTFQTWPNGSNAGSVDAIRGMCIRATATGAMTVTLEEGANDFTADAAYWDSEYATFSTDASGNTVLVGVDGANIRLSKPSHTAIREFNSLHAVTNAATGGTVTASIDLNSPFGGRAMKLAFGVGVTQHDVTISGFSLPDFTAGRAKLVAEMYFEDARAVSQIQCFAGTDTGFATSMRIDHKLANSGIHHSHDVQFVTLIPELAAANTLTATDDVAAVRFRFQRSATAITNGIHDLPGGEAASAYATNVWIKAIHVVEETLPFVVLTFDDASASWIDYLQPVLAARGLKGTFGVNKNDVGSNDALYITEAELNTLYDYGHDVSSHNLTNTAFTIATMATYVGEYRTCRDWHRNAGRDNRLDYHPYVQGAFNPELSAALASEGVRWARSVNDRNFERPLRDYGFMMQMPSRSLGSGTSQAAAQGWITQAEARQQDVVVMGHEFALTSASATTWAIGEVETFLDFCLAEKAAGRIGGIGSLSEYLRYIGLSLR